MKNLIPKLVTLLLVVVAVLSILLVKSEAARRDDNQRALEYEKELKKVKHEKDSLIRNDLIIFEKYRTSLKALEEADKEVKKTKKALEKAKNTPIIRYTDPELDSVLRAEYPR